MSIRATGLRNRRKQSGSLPRQTERDGHAVSKPYELIHKPTFHNQLLNVPREHLLQILEKTDLLRSDPAPRGNAKKKLHGYKGNVYRLRAGNYRVLYTFGQGWVALLGVDDRKDVYKGDKLIAELPSFNVADLADAEEVLLSGAEIPRQWLVNPTEAQQPEGRGNEDTMLPTVIDEELLSRLKIDPQFFVALQACKTLDELAAVGVPNTVRDLVFDCIVSPDFDQVLQEPSFATGSVTNLLKFYDGDLLGFLLKLEPEQQRLVDWAAGGSGPTLIKGGPGTGKSTVAIHIARTLVETLRSEGISHPRILFTTYTNALTAFSNQQITSFLGRNSSCVEVTNFDKIVVRIVRESETQDLEIPDAGRLRAFMHKAIGEALQEGAGPIHKRQIDALRGLNLDYLLEEVGMVIEGREIRSLEEYLSTARSGRRVPFGAQRRIILWRVYQIFCHLLVQKGAASQQRFATWHQVRREALNHVRSGRWLYQYDAVIVDEAQDIEPTVLRLLVSLCKSPNRLVVAADANQSIYGSSFRWTDVHEDLRFRGRTGILRNTYRSTRQIGQAASSYLQDGLLEELETRPEYTRNGDKPSIILADGLDEEVQVLAKYVTDVVRRHGVGFGACAILTPTNRAAEDIAKQLNERGITAEFMPRDRIDINKPVVKTLTMSSAKGLEFPVVAIAGFFSDDLPGIVLGGELEEQHEAVLRARRTMFVAMTRAMHSLVILKPSRIVKSHLNGFDEQYWQTSTTARSTARHMLTT